MKPALFLLLLVFPLGFPKAAVAQAPLDHVETFMGQGRIFQAREILQQWLQEEGDLADRIERQRGIWLRALLTVDPSMAALDFRRLVLEFPGGPYSDDALFRLAQGAESRGDLREAWGHMSALERDYPSSPHGRLASAWMREHVEEVEVLAPAPGTRTEVVHTPIMRPEERRSSPEPAGSFSVQLGAYRNLQGARSLLSQLTASGHEARMVRVRGNELLRVRVGRFATRQEASDALQALVRDGFEATLATDADLEEEVR